MKITGKGIVNGIGFAVGITGFVLSIYFYKAQEQFKALSFVVDPKHILVLSPKSLPTSKLTIFDQDGKQITRSLFSAGFYLWNSGTETILAADVIVPLVVEIPETARLLELQVLRVSRPDITQTSANIEERREIEKPVQSQIQFHFRVLEPGEGIRLSCLYEGEGDEDFSLKGGVTGIRKITDSNDIAQQKRWSAPWKENGPILRFLAGAAVAWLAYVLIGKAWKLWSKRLFPRGIEKAENILGLTLLGLICLALVFAVVQATFSFLDPWLHPEKVVRQNIRDYIPTELTAN
jgi:hypothetical protein